MSITDITELRIVGLLIAELEEVFTLKHVVYVRYIGRTFTNLEFLDLFHVVIEVVGW